MADYTFVLNPEAGKGAGRKVGILLEQLLPGFGKSHELVRTERAGHATEIARSTTSPFVVAVGGDGTLNEVANALVGSQKTIGIIPAGSGNDFIRSIGIPRSVQLALECLKTGRGRVIDAGRVQTGKDVNGSIQDAPERYFVNGVGIGFDASVARRVSEIKHLRGTLLYLLAVLQTLGKYKSPEFHGTTDDRTWRSRELLVAAGNGRCAGGGFYLTPEARVDDGLLDVCIIDDVSIPRILRLIPTVLGGKKVQDECVTYLRSKGLALRSSDVFNVHADGEIVGREVNSVKVGIVPSALCVVGGSQQD